jgi:hypothetical protein
MRVRLMPSRAASDEFSQFWLRNGLNYVWQFVDLEGNA